MRVQPRLILALFAASPAWLLWSPAQESSPQAPEASTANPGAEVAPQAQGVPDGVAAMLGNRLIITMDEYADYLIRKSGRKPLEDLMVLRLLEDRAAELGLEVGEEAFAEDAVTSWNEMVELRHRGDETAMLRELNDSGFDRTGYLANLAEMRRREALESAIVMATREATDELLKARFESDYGQGGVRVEVRHVLIAASREKARLTRAGTPPEELTGPRLQEAVDARAAELARRLNAGEDFAELAKLESDDISAKQTGGFLPGYNYQRYGEDFAQAVRAAEIGQLIGPIETPAGRHLLEVTERTTTDFEAVGDELIQAVLTAEVSPLERFQLRRALLEGLEVRTF